MASGEAQSETFFGYPVRLAVVLAMGALSALLALEHERSVVEEVRRERDAAGAGLFVQPMRCAVPNPAGFAFAHTAP